MTIKNIPDIRKKEAIAKAAAVLQHYYNPPMTLEDIQRHLNQMGGIGYAEDDIISFLRFNGKNMVGHLTETICKNFSSLCGKHTIPPKLLYAPATVKAYDSFIPICERWVKELKAEQNRLKKELETATD